MICGTQSRCKCIKQKCRWFIIAKAHRLMFLNTINGRSCREQAGCWDIKYIPELLKTIYRLSPARRGHHELSSWRSFIGCLTAKQSGWESCLDLRSEDVVPCRSLIRKP